MLRTAGTIPVRNGKEVAMPAQPLPKNPSLENLRKQAKSLRKSALAKDADALGRVREFHPRVDEAEIRFSLADAQLVIARSYGFASWSKLKEHLDVVQEYSWSAPPHGSAECDTGTTCDQFIRLACL